LLGGEEAMIVTGNDNGRHHIRKQTRARYGLLEQRALAGQRKELLGQVLARHRPQASAAATAEDEGD
jgi:hypothetical protein